MKKTIIVAVVLYNNFVQLQAEDNFHIYTSTINLHIFTFTLSNIDFNSNSDFSAREYGNALADVNVPFTYFYTSTE